MHGEGGPRRSHGDHEPDEDEQLVEHGAARDEQRDGAAERERRDGQPGHAQGPLPEHAVPARDSREHDAGGQEQAAREVADRHG